MSRLREIIGHSTILIPMDDLSAISVAENAKALSRWFLFPQLAWDLPRQLANKASLYSLCVRLGIPCPRSVVPHSVDDVREFVDHSAFPIVMKPAEQWSLVNEQRYNPVVIHNRETLFEIYERCKRKETSAMILQQYIAGEDWIYHGYCNSETNSYLSFTGKKLLDYPAGAGSTAVGLSLHNEEFCSQAEFFLKAISYSGICDMDWRLDKRDGRYKILDYNPRIGLNFRMFETSAGIDVVRAQHLNLTGRSIRGSPMVEGRLLTVESLYFLSTIHGGRRSILRIDAFIDPLTVTRELAWWSSDDPLPFFVMGIRLMFRFIMGRLRRIIGYPLRWMRQGFAPG